MRYDQYIQTEQGKIAHRKSVKNFMKTEKGKKFLRQQRAKRRNYGYNELFKNILDDAEKYDWHHINDNDIVAIPKDLHQLYSGSSKYHRDLCNEIVKQIYGEFL